MSDWIGLNNSSVKLDLFSSSVDALNAFEYIILAVWLFMNELKEEIAGFQF